MEASSSKEIIFQFRYSIDYYWIQKWITWSTIQDFLTLPRRFWTFWTTKINYYVVQVFDLLFLFSSMKKPFFIFLFLQFVNPWRHMWISQFFGLKSWITKANQIIFMMHGLIWYKELKKDLFLNNNWSNVSWNGIQRKICNLTQESLDGITVHHISAFCGVKSILELIISSNINPNPSKGNGVTPIYSASYQGHIEIVKFLASKVDNPREDVRNLRLV